MRIIAIRNKARDVRFIAFAFVAASLFTDSRWETSPLVSSAFLLSCIVLVSFAALLRAWSVLYIAGYKNTNLIMKGPFSICRNPIYLSTVMGFYGIALDTNTFTYPVFALVAFSLYFFVQVKSEEENLLRRHGDRFLAYCKRTPRLIPNFELLDEPAEYTVHPAEFRRWIGDAVWFILGLGLLEFVDTLHETGVLPVFFHLY